MRTLHLFAVGMLIMLITPSDASFLFGGKKKDKKKASTAEDVIGNTKATASLATKSAPPVLSSPLTASTTSGRIITLTDMRRPFVNKEGKIVNQPQEPIATPKLNQVVPKDIVLTAKQNLIGLQLLDTMPPDTSFQYYRYSTFKGDSFTLQLLAAAIQSDISNKLTGFTKAGWVAMLPDVISSTRSKPRPGLHKLLIDLMVKYLEQLAPLGWDVSQGAKDIQSMNRGMSHYDKIVEQQPAVKYLDPDLSKDKLKWYSASLSEIAIRQLDEPKAAAELLEWWSFAVTRDEQIASYHATPVDGKPFIDALYENWAAMNGDIALANVGTYFDKADSLLKAVIKAVG